MNKDSIYFLLLSVHIISQNKWSNLLSHFCIKLYFQAMFQKNDKNT